MPILKNAKKALRVSERKRATNQRIKSRVKSATDKVKKGEGKAEALPEAFSAIDKAVKKNLIHSNKASRLKSKLSKAVTA